LKDSHKGEELAIISNGPSLEHYLDDLKEQKLPFTMTLNDATFMYSNRYDEIFPSACCVIHGGKDVYDRCFDKLGMDEVQNTILFSSIVASKDVVSKWQLLGGKYYFFCTSEDKLENYDFPVKIPILGAGATVGYSSLSVGIYLGFKKITVYGLDLCYLENKKYAFDVKMDFRNDYVICKDLLGNPVLTDQNMLRCRKSILDLVKNHPDIQFNFFGGGIIYSKELKNLESHK
jgi:hypothetical protein